MLRQLMSLARKRSHRHGGSGPRPDADVNTDADRTGDALPPATRTATATAATTLPAGSVYAQDATCAQDTGGTADVPLGLPFMIRPAAPADLPALAVIFRQSVKELAARDYDADQLAAWSARSGNEDFLAGLASGVTIVAEHHGDPVAFAQLEPADHVRMLYVRPDWAGLGIATLLCQYLEDEARIAGSSELTTAASHTARRFFESMGYRAETEEVVQVGTTELGRTLMRKSLGGRPQR